ncbi:MAG: SpoIIE family protein phosphatase [bacterium]|nr:SpoIIE family protein phosphatase [bacterium]
MFKKWEKIDIFILVLLSLTIISYLFFKPTFQVFLWTLLITAFVRVLFVVKKKLFWKVRNRLMFSGVFLVVTPLVFMGLFFLFVLFAVIGQYGSRIMNNVMDSTSNELKQMAIHTLEEFENDSERKMMMPEGVTWPPNFAFAFYRKKKDGYKVGVKHPESLDVGRLIMEPYIGYFHLEDTLYFGIIKTNDIAAIMYAFRVNQQLLDRVSSISGFTMEYIAPTTVANDTEATFKLFTDPKIISESSFSLPTLYKYAYKDFDDMKDGEPRMKNGSFALMVNFTKIFEKLMVGQKKRALYLLFALFASFIVVSFVIGFRSVRVVTRSINMITKGTQRIRNGDFSFRIHTRSGDQMQYLGECFNEMAAGINRLLIEEKEKHRLEEELRIARSIQLKLLPDDTFSTDDFEVSAVNIPATEIAGDYFDYFYKEGEYFTMLVADVSGKGASAAFYMAELKGVVNHLQKVEHSPANLIAECHDSLNSTFDRITFITINIAKILIPEKKFLFARAGHTPALFYSAETGRCEELFPSGMAIGLLNFGREKIEEIEVPYHGGDILFFFSDGLSEIMNDEEEMLGVDNLKQIICDYAHQSAEEIKQHLLDFSIEYSEREMNRDDLTFIILKVN